MNKEYGELRFLKYNFDKNRKAHIGLQIRKLNNYIASTKAYEDYSKKIIRIINNPFIKKDPEAILFYVKDYCENALRICIEEKTKAHTELSALKKMKTIPKQEEQPTQTQQEFNVFNLE